MTRNEIQRLISHAANRFLKTLDANAHEEVLRLSCELAKLTMFDVLEDALKRCRTNDMRTSEVYRALTFLESQANSKWLFGAFRTAPFEAFRTALDNDNDEKRWQNLNASLNRIRFALGLGA